MSELFTKIMLAITPELNHPITDYDCFLKKAKETNLSCLHKFASFIFSVYFNSFLVN